MTDAAAPPLPNASELTQDGPAVRLFLVDGSAYLFRAYHALPPLTRKSDGLPVGAQLIGPHGGDARLLSLAQAIDENVRGFTAPELKV